MKHFTKLFVGILFLILGGTQSGMAQTIDDLLLKVAITPEEAAQNKYDVFLYNVDKKQFVHGGGRYGMQTVLSERGIRFKVISAGNGYYLESAIVNKAKGSCIGIDNARLDEGVDEWEAHKVYLDRPEDKWAVISFNETEKEKIYYLTTTISGEGLSNGTYYYHYKEGDGGYVHADRNGERNNWCLIKRDDYNEILKTVAEQGRYNITGLIGNSRFLRNVSDADNKFWSVTNLEYGTDDYCTTIDPNLGTNGSNDQYAIDYGAFGCVEIGAVTASESAPVEFYQTIDGLKPGLYMVEAQAFFDKNDYATYKNGAYNTPNTTDASNAYLFANGEETLIPVLNSTDQATFENYTTTLKDALDRNNKIYFRRNVAAAYFLAQGDAFEPDESYHRVRVYVNVTADEGQETGTLKLGVNKKGTEGRVYVDNFGLYFIGNNEIGLDAYQRDVNEVDQNTYQQMYPFHLSRKFVLSEKDPINPENDKWNWNAITLPMDVYASQITETFGEDAKLCKLEGVNPKNKDQILFTPVDLSDYSKPAIERGGCYLICVTKGPRIPEGEVYKFLVKKENDPEQTSQDMVFPYGNIYTITGVSCPGGMLTPAENTVTTEDRKLSYTYFYHRPDDVPAGSYVMSGGKMYHIPNAWTGLLGTCWYITDLTTSSNSKVMAIEGEGGTTDINGIVTEVPGDKAMEGVYNINGQKVADGTSLEGLPKGIYIVNGKKHVVK